MRSRVGLGFDVHPFGDAPPLMLGGVTITDVRTPARGFPITNRYTIGLTGTKIGIHPGAHEFKASVEGAPDQVWKVEITNGPGSRRRLKAEPTL